MAAPKIAVDITDYLTSTTGLTNVFVGPLTSSPINQYAVMEYSGPANVKTHGGGAPVLEEANLQIQVRHASAQTALTNIHTVVDALDGLSDVTINGTAYTYMTEISRPRILDRQEDGSIIYIWEVRVQSRR